MRSAILVVLLFASYAFAQRPKANASGWYMDYASAKAEAKRSGKPMFVTFRCEA